MNEPSSKFTSYGGVDFLAASFPKRDWLIENIIRERDTVLFVGDEKAGKSLFIQQMICSLTTQHSFIDKYVVRKPCSVTYLQLEGEIEDTQDRFKRLDKNVAFGPDFFQIIYSPSINLELHDVAGELIAEIKRHRVPDVLVIDPLYMAMSGSLSDDTCVRAFLSNVRWIKNVLKCAIIIVHHTHKIKRSRDGMTINEGDEATFGSKFLKAYPDHTMLLIYDKKTELRTMICQTQRMGDVEKNLVLNLVQPDPLYFEEVQGKQCKTVEIDLYEMLKQHPEGMRRDDLQKQLDVSHDTFYKTLKKLGDAITKERSGKSMVYKIKEK